MYNNQYNLTISDDNINKLNILIKTNRKYLINLTFNNITKKIIKLPKIYLSQLQSLFCIRNNIYIIPNTYIFLTDIYISNTYITELPDTLINLKKLHCEYTNISIIPDAYINLQELYCNFSQIKFLPSTLLKLKILICNNGIIIPDNIITLTILNIGHNSLNISNKLINISILLSNNGNEDNIYLNKFKQIKFGFKKFIYKLKIYMMFKYCWNIYEIFIKNKYHPNNITYKQLMNL